MSYSNSVDGIASSQRNTATWQVYNASEVNSSSSFERLLVEYDSCLPLMDLNYTKQLDVLQYTVFDYVRSAINDAS
jgi:hypothetical protein